MQGQFGSPMNHPKGQTILPYKMTALKNSFLLAVILLLNGCKQEPSKKSTESDKKRALTSYVNPFLGTAPLTDPKSIGYTPPENWRVWAGLTYPGSSLPNAMVQLSPITEYGSGAGYEYEDTQILGFAHTNKGHWNLCNIPVLPLSPKAEFPFSSTFDHADEKASPAYYGVQLKEYGVQVRLSSTLRCGIHEYTYADTTGRRILFDLGRSNNRVSDWTVEQIGTDALSGYQQMGRHGDKIYFYASLDQSITAMEIKDKGKSEGYAIITLEDGDTPVTLRIGLSFVSVKNAAENLQKEIGNDDLDAIHRKGEDTWEALLSKIQVSGGSEREKQLFYSSFYRSFLWPALRSDANGEFTDEEGNTQNKGFDYYTLPSLWDTYRNKLVLLGLVSPEVTNNVIKSIIDKGELKGFIPTFFHGDHAAPFITGSYLRGIGDFDVEKAYALLLNNAYKEGGTRPFISEYIEKGFISDPEVADPHVETKAKAGVSKTLEYAYDDHSLALLAKAMNDTTHYNDLKKRSYNYKNMFDAKTKFMRGRLDNGDWITPFDPQYPYYEYMYREANAWQLSFYAPHDMEGLVTLYGGKQDFESKLDSLFTTPWNPQHIARNVSGFMGQYCHGNQPDHEAPFAYYFVDRPEKSQAIIDRLLSDYYGIGEHGLALSGMDDAGEMSSWYVFSALGLYPLSPADPEYLVTVPIFDEVRWKVGNGKELLIQNPNKGRKLEGIKVGDAENGGYFISHDLFKNGGKIELMTAQ
tara:strand:+ start:16189 stop:18438 length:2250 start_codon:yes stop_codon:yes gene_type:complete